MPYRAERQDAKYEKRTTEVQGAQVTEGITLTLQTEFHWAQLAEGITNKARRESVTMKGKKRKSSVEVPVKLYRIGEVVESTGFSRQTIHNYTTMGLIEESSWTEGGHRLYDESVFERLYMIMELRKTKTLEQIKGILKNLKQR